MYINSAKYEHSVYQAMLTASTASDLTNHNNYVEHDIVGDKYGISTYNCVIGPVHACYHESEEILVLRAALLFIVLLPHSIVAARCIDVCHLPDSLFFTPTHPQD